MIFNKAYNVPNLYYSNGTQVKVGDKITVLGQNNQWVMMFDKFNGCWTGIVKDYICKEASLRDSDNRIYLTSDVTKVGEETVLNDSMMDVYGVDMRNQKIYPTCSVQYKSHIMKLVYRADKLSYMWHIKGTSRFIYFDKLKNYMIKMNVIEVDENEKVYTKELEEIDIDTFRNSGLLWLINSLLHVFGIALCVRDNRVIPCKTTYRGFRTGSNNMGYDLIAKYMEENIDRIRDNKL